MRKILGLYSAPGQHWVGDGFPVRSMTVARQPRPALSPFIMLDYAGPAEFAPAERPRGVGSIPTAVSRRSPSSTRARWSIATRPATAG